MADLRHYRSLIMDSSRWWDFEFRTGDVVISTPPKAGTTWTQMLCALLIFDSDTFYAPLSHISPWLDMSLYPPAEVTATLAAQEHRRFIKTHTPLDGIPYDERVTYVCVGRDPRDAYVSWMHHMANMDIPSLLRAREIAIGLDDLGDFDLSLPEYTDPVERFLAWVDDDADFSTLKAALHHYRTFWECDLPNAAMFHYSDLKLDLPGQMRRLADVLDIEVSDERLAQLAAAASFSQMKQRAEDVAPNAHHKIWLSTNEFFHRGSSGQWHEILDDTALARYEQRVAALAPAELATWSHHGWLGNAVTPTG
jgi:hypothetical protein